MVSITDPNELTPVELRNGRFYKREDLHRNDQYGVNGAKFRACRFLMGRAVEAGATSVVSASSVLSPQAAMAGVLAEEFGLDCTLVLGASKPETAPKHVSVKIAMDAGATLNLESKVAYNPVIQQAGNKLAKELGAWQLPYGITTEANAPAEEVEAFLEVGGRQVANLPREVETLVIPFGSGNTAAGVFYGLARFAPTDSNLKRVVLIGVGPDRLAWVTDRLAKVGVRLAELPVEVQHIPLHGWYADYGDRMPETADDIVMHPTYEGKVVRFLNGAGMEWWDARDGKTCMWIVGGPI
jgi:1-aminocyclopropane-1-carboxylate deaminase/D-cysteine desulfhydrase-like pyridoxal-dependent ACC family enzyme